jgi:hypothetical protein
MIGIILAIFYTALFIFLIRRHSFFNIEGVSRNVLTLGFIVKIFFGIAFWFVYTQIGHYQHHADAILYFEDGKAIYKALYESPLDYIRILLGSEDPSLNRYIDNTGHWLMVYNQGIFNESRTIIRFNALVDIFSFGNYHVHTVFICFVSLIGLTGILKTFLPYFMDKKKELIVWGSGVLKEGLILFAMGMLIYHFHKILNEQLSLKRLFLILLFGALLAITKAYILAILLPLFIAHAWIQKTGNRKPAIKYMAVFSVGIAMLLLQNKKDIPFMLMDKQQQSIYMSSGGSYLGLEKENKFIYIAPKFKNRIIPIPEKPGFCKIAPGVSYVSWYFERYTDSTYVKNSTDTTTYWTYYDLEPSGSRIDIPALKPTYASVIQNAPIAFANTAFRPTFLDAKNPMMLFSAIENCFFALFLILCLLFPSSKNKNIQILCYCLSFSILLFVLIGLTTPILGAVVRYKIPALPFFLIAFLVILDKDKLLKKLPILKRFIA